MSELKPCPFCGSRASFRTFDYKSFWAECDSCGIATDKVTPGVTPGAKEYKSFLAEKWNRRPTVADQASSEPMAHGLPAYPKGVVVGPCVCGSWPGGECLKCPVIPAPQAVTRDTVVIPRLLAEIFFNSTSVPRFKRILEAALKDQS